MRHIFFRSCITPIVLLVIVIQAVTSAFPDETQTSTVPNWAKDAIWYQIFPERFSNGDTYNDPTPQDLYNSWPYHIPENWQIHPWTSDWYKFQTWEQNIPWHRWLTWAKPGQPNFIACAGVRRYGGDLQGVINKLSYLKQLGVTAIYFNPLFESPSLHKYDAAMYHHIDNNFGPNPKLDQIIWGREDPADPSTWQWTSADSLFLNLIKLCHENGIKVIIDGVFNHVGNNFWAFKDVIEHQEKSKYKDWFYIESWDDPSTTQSEFQYRGWYGVADLPELKEDENGLIKPIRDHIHAVVKRWMDPNGDGDPSDGIDGWRLDVADMVDIQFWKVFRSWVKEINPEAYLTGEIWWEDFNKNKMYNASPWLNTAFDGVMNYRVARAIKQFVIDRNNRISAPAFKDSIQTIFTQYPFENVLVSQNLMDSHDVDRIASQIVNPDRWYDHGANPFQNPEYQVRRPNTQEWSIFKLVVGLQMMLPGAPMIYYGDEAGMWGGDDPDCRKPMVWPELKYEPETHHPFGYPRPKDEVEFNTEIFNWYRKLISIRRSHPEISRGAITFPDEGSSVPGLLMFVRSFHSRRTLVILNNRPESLSIALNLHKYFPNPRRVGELITNRKVDSLKKININIPPFGLRVFANE